MEEQDILLVDRMNDNSFDFKYSSYYRLMQFVLYSLHNLPNLQHQCHLTSQWNWRRQSECDRRSRHRDPDRERVVANFFSGKALSACNCTRHRYWDWIVTCIGICRKSKAGDGHDSGIRGEGHHGRTSISRHPRGKGGCNLSAVNQNSVA